MGFINASDNSNVNPAAYSIDGGSLSTPSFPSANATLKQSLFTATALDPNVTHYVLITVIDGAVPYSLTNFRLLATLLE